MNIGDQKTKLARDIKLFTRIGAVSAVIALIPLICAGVEVFGNHGFFKENELGDFIGGTSGTFASFAGVAFVYVAFLGQRLQILMQQEELELNRNELQATRFEIQGQRKQLELQNKQFEIQYLDTIFYNLLDNLRSMNSIHLTEIESMKKEIFDELEGSYFYYSDFDGDLKSRHLRVEDEVRHITRNDFLHAMSFMFNVEKVVFVKGIINPVFPILLHISRLKSDDTRYIEVLLYSIKPQELFLFFYVFTLMNVQYSDLEKSLLKDFLKKIDLNVLIHSSHIQWLDEV